MDAGFITSGVLKGVLLPGALSLILLAAGWAGVRMAEQARGRAFWGALAIPIAFAVAYWLTLGWPNFPPVDTTKWLPYAALTGMLLGLLAAPKKAPWWLTALLRLAASVALPLLLLQPTIKYTWHGSGWIWITAIALALFVLWTITDAAAQRLQGTPMPLALGAAAGLLGLCLLLSHSGMLTQTAGMLAAAVGAAFIVALWKPHLSLAFGAIPAYILVYAGLILCGHFFAYLPAKHAVLLALAPAVPILAVAIPAKHRTARAIVALLLALALAGTAAATLYQQHSTATQSSGADYEYDY